MRTSIMAVAALAGGLLLLPLASDTAGAVPGAGGLKSLSGASTSSVELVRQGGGGGGGGGGGFRGGGGGGGKAIGGGGGGPRGGGFARGGGGGPRFDAGPRGGRDFSGRAYTGPRSAARNFDRNVDRNWSRGDRNGNRGRYAYRNDNWRHDHYRHRNRNIYLYGAPYWAYGAYAYGGDCYWLRQQAYATGSPYWWDRYNACVGYY